MHLPFKALYIHVPFCVKRCAYCDFHTRATNQSDSAIDAYIEKMVISLRRASKADLLREIETVYVGGGTPTHLGHARLTELLYAISTSMHPDNLQEFTIEANPESLTDELTKDARALGVNRISIGVQSLDNEILATLGRAHDAKRALEAIEIATRYIDNISADVMCGIMGQSEDSLASTISALIDAGISHASIYPLMIEDGTPLCKAVDAGEIDDVDDDTQAAHMQLAAKILEGAGFSRYEVASYAKPGRESRHNSAYWTGKPYLGLGDGASSMIDARDLDEVAASKVIEPWTPQSLAGSATNKASRIRIALADGGAEVEALSEREVACEDAMLAMRMSAGISQTRADNLAQSCPQLKRAFGEAIDKGLARISGDEIVPTEKGWLLGNELYGLLWDCASD